MAPSRSPTRSRRAFAALCLATLGVVYGDIGTSPLYTISEIFFGPNRIPYTPQNALGATSLVLWILTLSVTLKYVLLVLRAGYENQGGTFALLALIQRSTSSARAGQSCAAPQGQPRTGSGRLSLRRNIITPAMSVLSAVEG